MAKVFKPIFFSKFSSGKNSPNGTRFILSYEFNKFKLWSYTERELKYLTVSLWTDLLFIPRTNKWFSLKFLPLICYEIIYSGRIFNNSDFDFIINISEDGWFGQSIGPKQHFIHSIYRAIESGKYVLRSSNNGISAIINPIGDIEQEVSFNQTGYIDFSQFKKVQPTVFSKYGNKIFGLIILLYIFLFLSFNRIKNE